MTLTAVIAIAVVVFAVTSMLAVGLAAEVRDALAPWRNRRAPLWLAANFVAVPLLAWLITRVIPLNVRLADGLILLGLTAGAPFALILVHWARGNVGRAGGFVFGLMLLGMPLMPFLVDLLVPDVEVDYLAVAEMLTATMLLPFAVGVIIRSRWSQAADRVRPVAQGASYVAVGVMAVCVPLSSGEGIGSMLLSWILPATVLFFGGAYLIGYAVAGPGPHRRTMLGLITSQRNFAAANVIAVANFPGDTTVLLGISAAAIVSMGMMFPIATALRRRRAILVD